MFRLSFKKGSLKLRALSKRVLCFHRRLVALTVCLVFGVLTTVYYFSNVSDILFYYLSSGFETLPLSIHCNEGRLGNQMCTYATIYGLSTLNKRKSFKSLSCNLKHLKPYFPSLSSSEVRHLYFEWNSWKILSYFKKQDASIPHNSNFINGYIYPCSYTFFDHVQDEIRQEFRFSDEIQQHAVNVLKKANVHRFKNVTYVGVHVRRGDYLDAWLNQFGGTVVNMEYFQKAVDYFNKKYQTVIFVLVSDDRVWCIQNLSSRFGMYVAEDAPSPAHDLAVLANCNHTLMTYGTFGFWGGYLAGGDVVYFDRFLMPNTTFANESFIFDKMYPPRWKGIVTTNISGYASSPNV